MWTVFLMANVAESPETECEIHAHQTPEVLVHWRNRFEAPFNQRWLNLISINNIESKSRAFWLRDTWRAKTRGLQRYIAKAFYLAKPLIETGEATLEVVPWPLEELKEVIAPYYKGRQLDWPPYPLLDILQERTDKNILHFSSQYEEFYSAQRAALPLTLQKPNSVADHIRMYDIRHDVLQTIPTGLLQRFLNIIVS